MTVAEALRAATDRLSHTSDTARMDAELLMAHALGVSRSDLIVRHLRDDAPPGFAPLVDRRAGREPVAYIVGRQEFYGLDLIVTSDTLIPRGDSETLIEAARDHFGPRPPHRILDMGTGTGALLLAALTLFPEAHGMGVDASASAALIAAANAYRHGLDRRARLMERDWHEPGWAAALGQFDLVLCNPPYVEDDAVLDADVREFEPAGALFAGPDGLDDYRAILPQLRELLTPTGAAVFEIGATQAEAVGILAAESGFGTTLRRDLGGRPRALILT